MKPTTTPHVDVYARVTETIVKALEAGVRPWMKPWTSNPGGAIERPLRHDGTPYRGVNVLLLWGAAADRGFRSATWMTYRQAQALGAQVRKGETGSMVVYANQVTKHETDEQGEDTERQIAFLKAYTVFNLDQIDGLPETYRPALPPVPRPVPELHAAAEGFFAATGATFQHRGDRAFYAPGPDFVQLPPPGAFQDVASYEATKAHELIHWTGHETRLARAFGQRFGDQAYAFEELVAELGAAFLCADLQITPEVREDHAAYLAHWLTVLKADKRAIFTAATQAQRAANFLRALVNG